MMEVGSRPDCVDHFPGTSRQGWQQKASDAVEHSWFRALGPIFSTMSVHVHAHHKVGFCSSAVSGNLCPCLHSFANVADHLILVAITAACPLAGCCGAETWTSSFSASEQPQIGGGC